MIVTSENYFLRFRARDFPYPKVPKAEGYCMYFPFSEPSAGEKSLAASSCRMIQSFPKKSRESGIRAPWFIIPKAANAPPERAAITRFIRIPGAA